MKILPLFNDKVTKVCRIRLCAYWYYIIIFLVINKIYANFQNKSL